MLHTRWHSPGWTKNYDPFPRTKRFCFFYFITGITFENRIVAPLHHQHSTPSVLLTDQKRGPSFRNSHGRFRNDCFIYFVFYVFCTDNVVWNLRLSPRPLPISRTGKRQKHTRKPGHFPHVIWPLTHESQHIFTKKWIVYVNYAISTRVEEDKGSPQGKS